MQYLVLHACNRLQAWIGRLQRTHVFEATDIDSRLFAVTLLLLLLLPPTTASCGGTEASVVAATEESVIIAWEDDDDDDDDEAFPVRSVPAQSIMVDAKAALRSASCGEKAML